jgi:ascorbate-specific PTS system EIIC-type component UlaA
MHNFALNAKSLFNHTHMFSKKLFSVLAILIGMTVSFGAHAQKIAVRGTVSDANGPVVGAVVLSGSTGVSTDADGGFSITVDPDAVLEVSCLGYLPQQVPVQGRS